MRSTLMLLFLLSGAVYAEKCVYHQIEDYGGPCGFSATVITDEYYFDYDNITITPIDTHLLAGKVRESLLQDEETLEDTLLDAELDSSVVVVMDVDDTPVLIASYAIDKDGDFLLLKYRKGDYPTIYFVGYFRSSGRWYLMWSGVGDPLVVQESYNRMISENPCALEAISYECKAAMILSIMYSDHHPLFVIESVDDIIVANAAYRQSFLESESPVRRDGLYYFSPSVDTSVVRFARGKYLEEARPEPDVERLDSAGVLKPLLIEQDSDTIRVYMTVYDIKIHEVARWKVDFALDGTVLSLRYVQDPIYKYGSNSMSHIVSPFHYIKSRSKNP